MNFANPVWLYCTPLIVIAIAGILIFGLGRRDALLQQFAAARLLDQLTEKADTQRILVKGGLILLACALIGIALARPQYGVNFIERKTRGLDIVFVLDSSKSMLATDLRPTRLDRARLAILDLVNQLESDRIGLVVFAGNAFLQTPPTLDYAAFRENLNAVGPSSISRGGSNIGQALREAAKAFPKDNNFKIVILLTDGEDLEEQAVDVARQIAKDGITVYSIGIGTPEGTYLKVRTENDKEEFVRDSSGQPVRSRLDELTLQKISQLTGGSYSRLAGQSLQRLYTSVLATLPRDERESELQETQIERYQWVLLAAVVCLVTETLIRRRKTASGQIFIVFILVYLFLPSLSYAEAPVEASADETIEAIEPGKHSDDPRILYNQAHSSLTAGDYVKAIERYEMAIEYSDDTELEHNALYNMAHANNQLGEEALQAQDFAAAIDYWKKAEALFKSANELNSNDSESLEDAKQMEERRKALEDFLNQQQQQQQQQQKENDADNNQKQTDSETEADGNKQDEGEPSSDDSSDQNKMSQSDENASEEKPSKDNESNPESADHENNSTEKSDENSTDNKESSEETDSDENSDSAAESTRDPEEDMQEQNKATGSDKEENDDTEGDGNSVPQKKSAENSHSEGTQETVSVSEDMDIADAQRLLDSLQTSERLLPFTETSEKQGKKRETRDW